MRDRIEALHEPRVDSRGNEQGLTTAHSSKGHNGFEMPTTTGTSGQMREESWLLRGLELSICVEIDCFLPPWATYARYRGDWRIVHCSCDGVIPIAVRDLCVSSLPSQGSRKPASLLRALNNLDFTELTVVFVTAAISSYDMF